MAQNATAGAAGGHSYAFGLGYLLLCFNALGWGLNFPVLKLGLAFSPPMLFTCMRMALGTLAMFIIAAVLGVLRLPRRGDLPILLSVGVLQNMAFITLVTLGVQYLPAGRAAILAYTTPIWVVPAAALFLGERFTLPRAMGVGLGLAGLLTVFNPLSIDWSNHDVFIGGGLIMLGTILWTAGLIHVRRHHWQGDVLSLIPWQLLTSVLALLPLALLVENPSEIDWQPQFIWMVVFSGAIASGICVAAQVAAIRSLPAVSLSLSSASVPAVGMLAAVWFLHEIPTRSDLTGFALIALGILVVGLADRRQALRNRSTAAKATPAS
ncbi:MAG TPA: EamA family transporter [Pseudomonas sp.]|nr:multidrug DMT transporter permease [Pseudomonas sp.]MBB49371.1 multidrug DMT transporter permease [Pseudomonadales bacterium]HCA23846.1 EamA family transporter [Pseudomonas sp.]